jgi:hypothetical protein
VTPATKQQTVFLVKGLRRIRPVTADILVCDKMTWARIGTHYGDIGRDAVQALREYEATGELN